MGWQQSVFQLVIIEGSAGSGLFVYSPSPGLGNLIASITPVSGTDSFGNPYLAGVSSYGPPGAGIANLFGGLLQMGASGTLATNPPQVSAPTSFSLLLGSGHNVGLVSAHFQLFEGPSISTDVLSIWDPVAGFPTGETWHSLGTLAGFTVTRGQYQMLPDGTVFFDIVLAGTGANAASVVFSNTLPAVYQPVTTKIAAMAQTRAITAGDAFPRLQVGSTGNVTVFPPAININSGVHFQGAISLA